MFRSLQVSIECVSPVKIHPPTFLNVSALSFLAKNRFLTDINPYVFKETLQGENGGGEIAYFT